MPRMIERPYVREVSIISMTFRLATMPFKSPYYVSIDQYRSILPDYTNESEHNNPRRPDIALFRTK